MKHIQCDCGYENLPGTMMCQSCGKPFDDDQRGVLNMRYEGAARRSQTKQRTFVDRIWKFFSLVRVGVWLLVITLLVSMLGTIYPQQMYIPSNADPMVYYPEQYGSTGYLYALFGFHNLYSSWWYVTLLVLIGISLTIASIDRGIPLYKALKRQRVIRHPAFLQRQRLHGKGSATAEDDCFQSVKTSLKNRRYHVRQEEGAIMGEKGRWSRWGPYVVHVGLIVLLLGALVRILPGVTLDEYVWVRDGEVISVPGTNGDYYIQSQGFTLELYENTGDQLVPKDFITEAVLYENVRNEETFESELQEVARHTIVVNQPFQYGSLAFYQSDYILNEFSKFTFDVTHQASGQLLGTVLVDLYDPDEYYELSEGVQVRLREYYPDFEFGEDEQPVTVGNVPNNPAFIFEITDDDLSEAERTFIMLGRTVNPPGSETRYGITLSDIDFNNVTGLMVRRERSLPIVYTGLGITMIGLVMCFYWQHRRIWIQKVGDEIWLSAQTNKNWYGLKKEVQYVIEQSRLPIDPTKLDREEIKHGNL